MQHTVQPIAPTPATTEDKPKESSSDKKTFLTQPQMKELALYVINVRGGVIMNRFQEFERFRVKKIDLANEAHSHFGWSIGPHQIDKAVKWYIDTLKEFKTPVELIALPPDVSVQEDMLKIENKKLKAEIETIKVELDKAKMKIELQNKSLDEHREKMKKAYEILRPGATA